MAMRLNLLDGFDLRTLDGARVALVSKKARALLAYLACPAGKVHARDRLASLLWSGSPEAQARASLRQAVAAIRRSAPDLVTEPRPGEGDGLAVDPDRLAVDVAEFEAADLDDADATDRAVDLYAGDFLGDLVVGEADFDNWVSLERHRLREHAVTVMSNRLANLAGSRDGHREGFVAQRLLAIDPLNEAAARAVMRLAARQGRHAAALQTYRQIRDLLRHELAVAPEPETQALAGEIEAGRRIPPAAPRPIESAVPEPSTTDGPSLRQLAVAVVTLRGDSRMQAIEDIHLAQAELGQTVARLAETLEGRWYKAGGTTTVILFGAERASETDAGRALRFAVDLRQNARVQADAVHPGIAVAAGLALVTAAGGDISVTGVPLDEALQLAMQAAPGEILITDAVRRDTRLNLRSEPAGINAWRAIDLTDALPVDDRWFVGRHSELRQWDAILTDCLEMATGMTVLIAGDAGIGKSRLAREFRRSAELRGFAAHMAPIYDFGTATGRDAMRLLVRSLLCLPRDARRRLRLAAAAAALPDETAERAALHDLLNLPLPRSAGPDYSALEEDDRTETKQKVLADIIRRLSEQQPLVLVIEDIHWADARLMTYLAALSRTVQDCPALLVLTGRPETELLDKRWRADAREPTLVTLTLRPFRPSEALDFAGVVAGTITETVSRCLDRAAGNPLFLEQLLLAGNTLSGEAVPGSIQSLILARLDTLPPEARGLAGAAAVLGLQVDPEALAHIAETNEPAVGALIDAALIRQQGKTLGFNHPLIRDAVYTALLASQRRALHRRAAEWFATRDPEIQAQHLARAEDPGAKQAYSIAAEAAAAAHRFRRAVQLLDDGLATPGEPVEDAVLLALKGELLLELGDVDDAVDALTGALEQSTTHKTRCRARLGLAEAMRVLDRYDDALAVVDQAADDCADEDPELQARIALLRGGIHFPRGELEDCLRSHRQAAALADRIGSPELEARAASGMGDAHYVSGRMKGARTAFERAVCLARDNNLVQIEAVNRSMLGLSLFYEMEVACAEAEARAALEVSHRIRSARSAMLAANVIALILMYVGALEEAREKAEQATEQAKSLGARRFVSECEAHAAFLAFCTERDPGAERRIAAAYESAKDHGLSYAGPMILAFLAAVSSDPATRAKALAEGDALLREGTCVSHNYLNFYPLAIEMAAAMGDWSSAQRHADALADYIRVEPVAWADLMVQRGRALAASQGGARAAWQARLRERGLDLDYLSCIARP